MHLHTKIELLVILTVIYVVDKRFIWGVNMPDIYIKTAKLELIELISSEFSHIDFGTEALDPKNPNAIKLESIKLKIKSLKSAEPNTEKNKYQKLENAISKIEALESAASTLAEFLLLFLKINAKLTEEKSILEEVIKGSTKLPAIKKDRFKAMLIKREMIKKAKDFKQKIEDVTSATEILTAALGMQGIDVTKPVAVEKLTRSINEEELDFEKVAQIINSDKFKHSYKKAYDMETRFYKYWNDKLGSAVDIFKWHSGDISTAVPKLAAFMERVEKTFDDVKVENHFISKFFNGINIFVAYLTAPLFMEIDDSIKNTVKDNIDLLILLSKKISKADANEIIIAISKDSKSSDFSIDKSKKILDISIELGIELPKKLHYILLNQFMDSDEDDVAEYRKKLENKHQSLAVKLKKGTSHMTSVLKNTAKNIGDMRIDILPKAEDYTITNTMWDNITSSIKETANEINNRMSSAAIELRRNSGRVSTSLIRSSDITHSKSERFTVTKTENTLTIVENFNKFPCDTIELKKTSSSLNFNIPGTWIQSKKSFDEERRHIVNTMLQQIKTLPKGTTVVIGSCADKPDIALLLKQMVKDAGLRSIFKRNDGTKKAVASFLKITKSKIHPGNN